MPRNNDERWIRQCEVCGREYLQRKPSQRTCSVACRARLPRRTGGPRAKSGLAVRLCQNPECGREYQPVRENQIACSRVCLVKTPSYQASQRRTDNRPERRAAQNRRRNLPTASDPEERRLVNLQANLSRAGLKITREQLRAWVAGRLKQCAICDRFPSGPRDLHLDHDHQTGQLRDWLCGNCNQGLGNFRDDPELLRAAADYIERHRVVSA